MPIFKQEIAKIIKGSLLETEDWWRLCYDTEKAIFYVEHEWSHIDPYNLSRPGDSGRTEHDADTWNGQGADKIEEARAALQSQIERS